MTVSELIVKLVFQANKSKVDDFIKSVKELNLSSIASLSAFGTMAVEMKNLMVWASQGALSMARFQTETGLSADQMGEWANIAKVAGINAQDAFQGVIGVQKTLLQMQLGMRSYQPFAIMGIQPSSDPFSVVKQWAQWAKGQKNKQYAAMMGESIGIPGSMLNMVDTLTDPQKLARIEALNKAWRESVRALEPMRKEYEQITLRFEKFGLIIATGIAPHLKTLFEMFNELFDYLAKYSKWIVGIGLVLYAIFNPVQVAIFGIILLMQELFVYLKTGQSILAPYFKLLGNGFGPMTLGASSVGIKMSGSAAAQSNTFHFTINGATDPNAVLEKVKKFFQDAMTDVVGQDQKDNY